MSSLECWNANDLIKWIQNNLSAQYHQCIETIKEHDVDGKLLLQCLNDKDAKSSLLQVLFPNANDAFLRLSFMRKIEKFNENYNNNNNKNNESKHEPNNDDQDIISNTKYSTTNSRICEHCGVTISSLLIENHQRHCYKQLQQELIHDANEENEANKEKQIDQIDQNEEIIAQIEENITILCEFCEIEFNIALIDEHIIYCGSRTEACHQCGVRDTLSNFKNNKHDCNITFNNNKLDINNNANEIWISSFERHLYDLERILHDRFIINYNNASSHFERFDKFGHDKQKLYQQKSNENVSKIRTYAGNNAANHITNESRHKFDKDIYKGKTKNELRKEYGDKCKIIFNLLRKILENIIAEPLNTKYRILKCNNKKLKSLIFSYSPCCEFLKTCDFVYIFDKTNDINSCYKLMNANNAKLKIGIGVLKYVIESFEQKEIKQDYEQNKWELNQAYVCNDKSIFKGSWSCKKCNHLNRKTSICKKCKTKKKHSLIKEKKERMEMELSVERWICGICGNRNAIELKQCDNCKRDKIVAAKQYKQYHQKASYKIDASKNNENNKNNKNDKHDDLYLHHDEWM